MRKKEEQLVITFESTTMALAMEKVCKEQKKEGRIIPLPREISAGCGLAWSSKTIPRMVWEIFMQENNIVWQEIRKVFI